MRTGWTCVLAVVVGVLSGCSSSQRPLPIVKDSASYNFEKGYFDRALVDYSEYIERRPDDLEMRVGLAKTYLKLDRPKEARVHATVAQDVRPAESAYADLLAESLLQANERESLVAYLQKRVSERGQVSDYIRMGVYQQALGNLDECKLALNTAARIDEGKTIAPHVALANMYAKIGDKKNEVRRLKMALYVEPANKMLLSRIAELGGDTEATAAVRPDELP